MRLSAGRWFNPEAYQAEGLLFLARVRFLFLWLAITTDLLALSLYMFCCRLYVDAYSNPFAPIDPSSASLASGGNALLSASPSFDAKVVKLIGQADKAIEYKGPMPL